ncbi:MAG: hypothetical protein HYU64_20805 [Armatimonadetes bacterium]|nr:hypothetical protein [Armatimonadota bacterium]
MKRLVSAFLSVLVFFVIQVFFFPSFASDSGEIVASPSPLPFLSREPGSGAAAGRLAQNGAEGSPPAEKVHVGVDTHWVVNSMSVTGPGAATAYDYLNYRGFLSGRSLSEITDLNFSGKVGRSGYWGAQFALYDKAGNDNLNAFYGVMPPYYGSVGWNMDANGLIVGYPQHLFRFNTAWYTNQPAGGRKFTAIAGTYYPQSFLPLIYYGEVNPALYGPSVLPLRGLNLQADTSWAGFEGIFSYKEKNTGYSLAQLGMVNPYEFNLYGLSVGSPQPQESSQGGASGQGNIEWKLNYLAFRDIQSTNPQAILPAKDNAIWGGKIGFPHLASRWSVDAQYAVSQNRTRFVAGAPPPQQGGGGPLPPAPPQQPAGQADVTGAAFTAALRRSGTTDLSLEYLRVEPTYDTARIETIGGVKTPTLLPVISTTPNLVQMHDYLTYPSNATGFRGSYGFPWQKGKVVLNLTSYSQIVPTPVDNNAPNFADYTFPTAVPGDPTLGTLTSYGPDIYWNFDEKTMLYNYMRFSRMDRNSGRQAMVRGTLVSSLLDVSSFYDTLGLSVQPSKQWALSASVTDMSSLGAYGTSQLNYSQIIPSVGVTYAVKENQKLSLTFRFLDYQDRATPANSFNGSHVVGDINFTF